MVQLPALNTPQFDWACRGCRAGRSRCRPSSSPRWRRGPSSTQPTTRPGGSTGLGLPTVGTLIANKVAAGLLDRFLAWTGNESQQTAEPQDPGRPANSGLRWTTSPARTSAHTAVSTGAPRPVALSCGCHGTAACSLLPRVLRRPVSARRWAPAVVADEPAAIATVAPGVGAIAASGGDGQSENAGGRAHPQVLQCVRLSACVGCQAVETGGLGFALRGGDGA